LWAASILDLVLRRDDLVWWQRLCWLLLVIFFPLIGALIYSCSAFITDRRDGMSYRDLETLRSRGVLTDVEYEQQRTRLDLSTSGQ
jgi:hypothetical protein